MRHTRNYYYQNNSTGELLTYNQMIKQAEEIYDFDDYTNVLELLEYYELTDMKIVRNNYNLYLDSEQEKYDVIRRIKEIGAILTGVSGCGSGYYIQLDATDNEAAKLNEYLEGLN